MVAKTMISLQAQVVANDPFEGWGGEKAT